METGGSALQGYPQLPRKVKGTLGFRRRMPSFPNKRRKKRGGLGEKPQKIKNEKDVKTETNKTRNNKGEGQVRYELRIKQEIKQCPQEA